MRINFSNYVNFGKTYIRETGIKNTNNSTSKVNFVEYDPNNQEDREQVIPLGIKWAGRYGENAWAACEIIRDFCSQTPGNFRKILWPNGIGAPEYFGDYKFFGLEDKQGNILAIGSTEDDDEALKISYLQTNPKHMHNSKEQQYKGLGEALTAEIVQEADNENYGFIITTSANDDFWKSSKIFKRLRYSKDYYLPADKFDKYIRYVKKKLNKKES